jgi:serine/threonine protein kinase
VPGPDATIPIQVDRVLAGRYRLIRPIAKGGMAEVWEGRDEILSRPVAVKVLQPHLATDSTFVERFRREAISAARLTHPGVVATFDTGTDAGTAWIVMELIRGDTLRHLLNARGPMDPAMAIDVAGQIADALAHAHRAGLVHRDVKPANILLVEEDGSPRAKVTDFGIAKATEGLGGLDLTRTGIVLGTPKYLSPEQVEGHEPDARADLYSLGVVLFEMLTGRPPFEGPTDMATAIAHVRQDAPRVSSLRPGIPPGLDDVVAHLLAKDPAARIPSATALRAALNALSTVIPSSRPTEDPTRVSRTPPAPVRPTAPSIERSVSALGGQVGRAEATSASAAGSGRPPGVPGRRDDRPVPATGRNRPATPGSTAAASGVNALGGHVGTTPPQPMRAVARSAADRSDRVKDGSWAPTGSLGSPAPRPTGLTEAAGGATRVNRAAGPPTSLFPRDDPGDVPGPAPAPVVGTPPRRRRRRWGPFLVVAALVVAGCVVAAVLLGSGGRPTLGTGTGGATATDTPLAITSVGVWMMNNRSPDNPDQTGLTFDGNTATAWTTDQYKTPTFSGLYSGMGLAIHLDGSHTLHQLTVDSSTQGWSAQTYVSASEPTSGQAVTAWGQPTDARTGIDGSTTFTLGGTTGEWVLLWLTNLGPADQGDVQELSVK